jgi:acetamidase/formamidase
MIERRTDHQTIPAASVSAGDTVRFEVDDDTRRLVSIQTTAGPERRIELETADENTITLLGPIAGDVTVTEETDLERGDAIVVRYVEAGDESGGVIELRRDRPLAERVVDGLKDVIGA